MPTVSDYLLLNQGGVSKALAGTWVQLVNNATSTAYVSTAASDANGLYTVNNVPAGVYTVKTGPTNVGVWTSTGDAQYLVAPDNRIFNPLDYGAKGDGTTNDTTALANTLAAMTAGGELLFPPLTFKYTTDLTPLNKSVLRGSPGTVLKPTGTARIYINANNDVVVRDLEIDATGQTTGATVYGILANNCSRIKVINCHVHHAWSTGIGFVNVTDAEAWDNQVHNCGDNNAAGGANADGIYFEACTRFTAERNTIYDCTRQYGHGVTVANGGAAGSVLGTIANNVIKNMGSGALSGGGAIQISSSTTNVALRSKNISVTGNTCLTSADSTLWLNGDFCTIAGNVFDGPSGNGIEIQDCKDFTISGNLLTNVSNGHGMWVHNGPGGGSYDLIGILHGTISGNVIDGVTTSNKAGMYITHDGSATTVRSLSITGNIVRNCQAEGITLAVTHGDISITGNVCLDNNVMNNVRAGIRVYGAASPANCSRTIVVGNRSGDTRPSGQTQAYGISIENLADQITVADNDVSNNVSGYVNNTSSGIVRIRGNHPQNPAGSVTTPGFPATTVAVTNSTSYDVIAYVTNGTSVMTAVIQGSGIGNVTITIPASAVVPVRIPAGRQFTPTYGGGAPAWVWYGE